MAAKRGRAKPSKKPEKPPKPLAAGVELEKDPVDASLTLMRQALEAASSSSEAANIGRAIAALSAEARKREDALVKRQGRMSLPEKVEFTKSTIEEWPQEYQVDIRDWLLTRFPLETP